MIHRFRIPRVTLLVLSLFVLPVTWADGTRHVRAGGNLAIENDRPLLRAVHDGLGWTVQHGDHSMAVLAPAGALLSSIAGDDQRWYATLIHPASESGRAEWLQIVTATPALGNDPTPFATPSIEAPWLASATTLVEAGVPRLLFWFEGARSTATRLRFAERRDNGSWTDPTTISPVGAGTQTALQACRLKAAGAAEPTVLLAWTAHDGEDDEIVWTRSIRPGTGSGETESRFEPPRELTDDDSPDLTPTLLCSGDRARVAWSSYEPSAGSYRILTSTLRQGVWSEAVTVDERPATFPVFDTADPSRGVHLLYRVDAPGGWVAKAIDSGSLELSTDRFEAETRHPEPPFVEISTAAGSTAEKALVWPVGSDGGDRLSVRRTGR